MEEMALSFLMMPPGPEEELSWFDGGTERIKIEPWTRAPANDGDDDNNNNEAPPIIYGGSAGTVVVGWHMSSEDLPRTAHVPFSENSRLVKLCNKPSPEARALFQKLYVDGDFCFQFFDCKVHMMREFISLHIFETMESETPLMMMRITHLGSFDSNVTVLLSYCARGPGPKMLGDQYDYFFQALPQADVEEFGIRLLHHIWRHEGTALHT